MTERTLVLIKPDGVERRAIGEIISRIERKGLNLVALDLRVVSVEVAQAQHFDYVIINALFETALFDLKTVVHSQRLKYAAQRRAKSQVFSALDLV